MQPEPPPNVTGRDLRSVQAQARTRFRRPGSGHGTGGRGAFCPWDTGVAGSRARHDCGQSPGATRNGPSSVPARPLPSMTAPGTFTP
jgi:hypothetical protein